MVFPRPRLRIALAVTLLTLGSIVTAAAADSPPTPEHPLAGGAGVTTRHAFATDQLPLLASTKTGLETASTSTAETSSPFLTRPYWNFRPISSVFDHCMPTGYYQQDGKVCSVDGTVALASNGADPNFPYGYAITPGGTDYLYYDGHNGWDIPMPTGTSILAAADGVITYAGWDSYGWGNTILIDHQNGFTTRYAHLSSTEVQVGQSVVRGHEIGLSGSTGNSTGPHLHFGL